MQNLLVAFVTPFANDGLSAYKYPTKFAAFLTPIFFLTEFLFPLLLALTLIRGYDKLQ